jgi:hypothetical protein
MERRRVAREPSGEPGAIICGFTSSFDCTILNKSQLGACIELPETTKMWSIPNSFSLFIGSKAAMRPCRVIWRSFQRMGVEFS